MSSLFGSQIQRAASGIGGASSSFLTSNVMLWVGLGALALIVLGFIAYRMFWSKSEPVPEEEPEEEDPDEARERRRRSQPHRSMYMHPQDDEAGQE